MKGAACNWMVSCGKSPLARAASALPRMKLVVFGLSLSSSWGNGHATTYRALLRAFAARGHEVLFLERDVPWYAEHRDLAEPDFCRLAFYRGLAELGSWRNEITQADAVIVGSYVPEGVAVGRLVQATATGTKAFYDIDTPVTLAKLARGDQEYITPELIAGYDLYLSFTGGPTLDLIETTYGSPSARALYCSVDRDRYAPLERPARWDLSYLGTYSPDRQPTLDRLLLEPARRRPNLRFVVAGPQYPTDIDWPANVERLHHVGPDEHAEFYGASRFTLNVTRADMIAAGWSPSVRLFEAAACGVPILSDRWDGLAELFRADREILLPSGPDEVIAILSSLSEEARRRIGEAGRERVLASHTAAHRAAVLETLLQGGLAGATSHGSTRRPVTAPQ
jgi:spore maturation protein CgeB